MDYMKKMKHFFHSDMDSLQRWKDLEFRSHKPQHHNKNDFQDFDAWKRQSDLIRFRNQTF